MLDSKLKLSSRLSSSTEQEVEIILTFWGLCYFF